MRWILDACTLIYLVKSKLFLEFIQLTQNSVVIDTSVHKEVIIDGKNQNYPDAFEAETCLNHAHIPIISNDISEEIYRMIDPGETSCFILAQTDGICVTSDDRAYNKFKLHNSPVIRLDALYFEFFKQKQILESRLFEIFDSLKQCNGIKSQSILFFKKEIDRLKKEGLLNE